MEYADRDIMELDKAGNYYCRHVSAMTGEGLHSKGDIAAELAYRDMEIDRLRGALITGASLLEQGCNASDMAALMRRAAAVPNA